MDIARLRAVDLDREKGELVILDQTLLPGEVRFLRLGDQDAIWQAIHLLRVRGAPAIGIAAGFAAYLAALHSPAGDYESLRADTVKAIERLAASRPTAVNLFWALGRMRDCLERCGGMTPGAVRDRLLQESLAIQAEDEAMCRAMGEHGLTLLKPGMGILTHCNAGQLAASRHGTALAPIYAGHGKGYGFRVFADETRPLLQGARLTAFELMAAGVDVTLICDNMAAAVMKNGWVQAVVVGCDRVAANGDVANKIGTAGVAVLAKHYNIPFYVCCPSSTIDPACPDGASIAIEERKPEEVTEMWYAKRQAPPGVKVFNPAFDVTDHQLVAAIVTENGVLRPPYAKAFLNCGK